MVAKAAQRRARALRRWTALSVFGVAVAAAGMWCLLFVPGYLDYGYVGQGPKGEISIAAPWVRSSLVLFACGGLVFCLVVSAIVGALGARTARVQARRSGGLDQRDGVHFGSPLVFWCAAAVLPGACLIVFPIVLILNMFGEMFSPSFAVLDRAKAPDGQEYVVLYWSVLQGRVTVLAQPNGADAFRSVFRVLGENNGDWPERCSASVIRPDVAPAQTAAKLLFFGPKGLVLCVVAPNLCIFAYDAPSGAFWGCEQIGDLSPFVLIEKNTSLREDDVSATQARLQSLPLTSSGVPRRRALDFGRRHDNPAVRALSALAAWDKRASDHLSNRSPDTTYYGSTKE